MDTRQAKLDLKDNTIYISGPMTGKKNLNFPAFHQAYCHWRERGYDVVNPAQLSQELSDKSEVPLEELTLRELALLDLQLLITRCTHIYMLEGWEYSKGAKAEHALAEWLGLTIIYQHEGSLKVKEHYDKEWWLTFQAEQLQQIKELTRRKNDDYTGGAVSSNPFANFDEAAAFGVDPLVGLSIRMGDKMQRLRAFCSSGLSLESKGDTAADIFKDLIGYSCLALGMLERKNSE